MVSTAHEIRSYMQRTSWKYFFLFLLLNCVVIVVLIALTFRAPVFVKVNGTDFTGIKDSVATFRMSLKVRNPNFFSISGRNVQLHFSESGIVYGEGIIDPFTMPKKAEADLGVAVKINFRQLIRAYNLNTTDTLAPGVSITGSFMPGFFIHKITLQKKIPKKEIVNLLSAAVGSGNSIRTDSFSIRKISTLETEVHFNILFVNQFNIDYTIKEIKANVLPAKNSTVSLGEVSSAKEVIVGAGKNVSVPLQVKAQNLSIVEAVFHDGLKTFESFYVDGYAIIGIAGEQIKIPFSIPYGPVDTHKIM